MEKTSWKNKDPVYKKVLKIIGLSLAVSLIAAMIEHKNSVLDTGNVIRRNENGAGAYEVQLLWEIPGVTKKQETVLKVEEQGLEENEIQGLLEAAEAEIMETFPGENRSIDEIRKDVCIQSEYQNGKVTADWSFGDYSFIDLDGKIFNEKVPKEGQVVLAVVELTCGQKKHQYEFPFHIYPKTYTAEEQLVNKVQEQLEDKAAVTEQPDIVLPQEVEGQTIVWKVRNERIPEKIMLLGIVAAAGVPLLERSRRRETEKKRKELLEIEYPNLIGKLNVLLGAGMTVYAAWKRIVENYCRRKETCGEKENPLYEEMLLTCHEIESGVSEAKAMERFGKRCGLHRYRKFCSLLTQNMRKGTRQLGALLENEVEDAFEERKNRAKQCGEEAGTKMLFPMMIMLGIVIAVVMIPAMMTLS